MQLRDDNRVPVWFGVSSVDGITPVQIQVNSSTGKVLIEDGLSVSAVITNGVPLDAIKLNQTSCIMGQSNTNSAVYLPVSVNPATGAILIKTT